MRTEQLTCHIGAELTGVSLRDAAHDPAAFDAVHRALLQHRVLFLRDQDISRQDHLAFARRLGVPESHPALPSPPDAPGLTQIYRSPDQPLDPYENSWHTDNTWRASPSKACVLRCVECPPVGGDTMWANMVVAYARLPEDVKSRIAGLRASHSLVSRIGSAFSADRVAQVRAEWPDVEHPVVIAHPQTGESVLYVNSWTTHLTNFNTGAQVRYGQDYNQGGADLLQYLVSQAYVPEYQVRWRWRPNSFAIWDNTSTQHYAVMDYPPCHRKMERAGIIGDAPY